MERLFNMKNDKNNALLRDILCNKETILKDIVNVQPMSEELIKPLFNNATDIDDILENAENKKELTQTVKDILNARSLIREKHPKGNIFIKDSMECPVCKTGTLHYYISDHINGHIHGLCSTKGCLHWME